MNPIPCTRRQVLKTLAAGAASLAVPTRAVSAQAAPDRPNIVLIVTDDQGYGDVGVNGNRFLKTPNLDCLAADGLRFTRFYCSPVCAPTRASLMTGRNYYRTGVLHTSCGGAKMHGDEITIAERLRQAGYATGIFGKWHLGDTYPMRPQDQGFAESLIHKSGGIDQAPDTPNSYFDPYLWSNGARVQTRGYCTDVFTDAAIAFAEAHRDQPFFLYLPTNAPHTPLQIAQKYVEPYTVLGLDEMTAKVYGMIANLDENVGRLLARLDALGLRDNTLVIFFGDNGPQQTRYTAGLRGRKGSVYEGGIRVPCFVRWPAHITAGRVVDRIAAHIDVHPTLLDCCGIEDPPSPALDGVSLLPLLRGETDGWPDRRLFFQCHRGLTPQRYRNCAVITQRYKLDGYADRFGWNSTAPPDDPVLELYDLEADPGETRDLAAEHPEIVAELRAAYDKWFDDVKSTRNFTPGIIHLGSDAENPTCLCRYQDATHDDRTPIGWSVVIEREGPYELTINRGEDAAAPGALHVTVNGAAQARPLAPGESTATFVLPAGPAMVDIWFQEEGKDRVISADNGTVGDVIVRRL